MAFMSTIEAEERSSLPSAFTSTVPEAVRGKGAGFSLGYIPALDGLRFPMTVGVLMAHTRPDLFIGAFAFMDMFFTLSGFLITSILIKDFQKHGRVRLKTFYIRRVMRLYPALIAVVLTVVFFSLCFSPDLNDRLSEAAAALLYFSNYCNIFQIVSFRYLGPTWSLAVEEQFYLLWPLAFIGLLKLKGLNVRIAMIVFAAALVFWMWRILLAENGASISYLYRAFDTRADSLLIGCGLAIVLAVVDLTKYPSLLSFCSAAMPLILIMMIGMMLLLDYDMRWYYYISPLFGSLATTISIVGIVCCRRSPMHDFYEHPWLVYAGRRSYGIYLWHWPIFYFLRNASESVLVMFLVGWPLTLLMASLSYSFLEKPIMQARPAS